MEIVLVYLLIMNVAGFAAMGIDKYKAKMKKWRIPEKTLFGLNTERPEALEAGDFILAGITTRELLNATDMAIEMKQKGVLGKPCPDYVDETVSMKVVRIIQGYVNVVNKMVWRKY